MHFSPLQRYSREDSTKKKTGPRVDKSWRSSSKEAKPAATEANGSAPRHSQEGNRHGSNQLPNPPIFQGSEANSQESNQPPTHGWIQGKRKSELAIALGSMASSIANMKNNLGRSDANAEMNTTRHTPLRTRPKLSIPSQNVSKNQPAVAEVPGRISGSAGDHVTPRAGSQSILGNISARRKPSPSRAGNNGNTTTNTTDPVPQNGNKFTPRPRPQRRPLLDVSQQAPATASTSAPSNSSSNNTRKCVTSPTNIQKKLLLRGVCAQSPSPPRTQFSLSPRLLQYAEDSTAIQKTHRGQKHTAAVARNSAPVVGSRGTCGDSVALVPGNAKCTAEQNRMIHEAHTSYLVPSASASSCVRRKSGPPCAQNTSSGLNLCRTPRTPRRDTAAHAHGHASITQDGPASAQKSSSGLCMQREEQPSTDHQPHSTTRTDSWKGPTLRKGPWKNGHHGYSSLAAEQLPLRIQRLRDDECSIPTNYSERHIVEDYMRSMELLERYLPREVVALVRSDSRSSMYDLSLAVVAHIDRLTTKNQRYLLRSARLLDRNRAQSLPRAGSPPTSHRQRLQHHSDDEDDANQSTSSPSITRLQCDKKNATKKMTPVLAQNSSGPPPPTSPRHRRRLLVDNAGDTSTQATGSTTTPENTAGTPQAHGMGEALTVPTVVEQIVVATSVPVAPKEDDEAQPGSGGGKIISTRTRELLQEYGLTECVKRTDHHNFCLRSRLSVEDEDEEQRRVALNGETDDGGMEGSDMYGIATAAAATVKSDTGADAKDDDNEEEDRWWEDILDDIPADTHVVDANVDTNRNMVKGERKWRSDMRGDSSDRRRLSKTSDRSEEKELGDAAKPRDARPSSPQRRTGAKSPSPIASTTKQQGPSLSIHHERMQMEKAVKLLERKQAEIRWLEEDIGKFSFTIENFDAIRDSRKKIHHLMDEMIALRKIVGKRDNKKKKRGTLQREKKV